MTTIRPLPPTYAVYHVYNEYGGLRPVETGIATLRAAQAAAREWNESARENGTYERYVARVQTTA